MTLMHSSRLSASKPQRNNGAAREQNPHHSHYNGLTRESRGIGGGLRPRVWLRLRAAAGGNWTPDGILQLEGEANFSLSWSMKRTIGRRSQFLLVLEHEAHPKTTLYGVVFQKIEWALVPWKGGAVNVDECLQWRSVETPAELEGLIEGLPSKPFLAGEEGRRARRGLGKPETFNSWALPSSAGSRAEAGFSLRGDHGGIAGRRRCAR